MLCLLATFLVVFAVGSEGLQTRPVSDAVAAGYRVWHANGCEGCHTLYGQGGAFAPDLTHIVSQRGPEYLREFMANPGAFHPGERAMPRLGLTAREIGSLLVFFEWVESHAAGWPPRPIQVSGGAPDSAASSPESAADAVLPQDAAARGRYWFQRPPAICATCHSLEPEVVIVGPSLAGIAGRAIERVPGLSAAEYLRASILDPGAYVVAGFQNVMAKNLGEVLNSDQINDIIAFLLTLE